MSILSQFLNCGTGAKASGRRRKEVFMDKPESKLSKKSTEKFLKCVEESVASGLTSSHGFVVMNPVNISSLIPAYKKGFIATEQAGRSRFDGIYYIITMKGMEFARANGMD
jgi:hypothetical protein